MEETISLKEMFHTIMRRLKLIIALPVLAVCLAGFVSFFLLTPIYQSSTQILVNHSNDNQSFNSQDIRTNIDLINTYSVIIKSPAILDKVIDNLQLEDTYSQLNERLQINSENNSQVVNITVKHEKPAMAVASADRKEEATRDFLTWIESEEKELNVAPFLLVPKGYALIWWKVPYNYDKRSLVLEIS
ncbi:YveK family protein, partial [Halalkalibacterium halodurans]|uniref:YveK family protein n=1 Tax=Halalkalibacterium halodurans TaxID=86665 RepID=UPI002E1D778B